PTPWGTPTVFNPEAEFGHLLGLSDELKFRVNQKSYPQVVCEMAGLHFRREPYVLELSDASRRRRQELLSTLRAESVGKGIGLNTGCGPVFRTKQWPIEGWLELIEFLQATTDAEIMVLGGKAEEPMNREILAQTTGLVDTGSGNTLEEF